MKGQWIGGFSGTNKGLAIVELDDMGSHFEGSAFAFSDDPRFPTIYAPVRTPDRSGSPELTLHPLPIDLAAGLIQPMSWLKNAYPEIILSSDLKTKWQMDNESLTIEWSSDVGTFGTAKLYPSKSSLPSNYEPESEINSWAQFKEYAANLEPNRYVFRGQESNRWRLRTHFHRAGRFDLLRFINADISALHANLSSLTHHIFNLSDPLQNAAFYSLVQHHGYPTPLLDWTYSPFIGAFFAFRNLLADRRSAESKARIFVLDANSWMQKHPRVQNVSPAPPHFSFVHPLAINNSRMVPQQAMSTVTNLDDIETFIQLQETTHKMRFLKVVDLPSTDRPQIMQELAMMGITAGSMFPGLDGACEQLKERFFER